MTTPKFKFQMYKQLQANIPNIYAEAKKAADEIGIPPEIRGKFGLTGGVSGCPAPLRRDIAEASEKGMKEVVPLAKLVDEIRELVKDYYGDEYDVASTSTCEAGLWTVFGSLFTPSIAGMGDTYRARYIAPYEKHWHHQGGYGRPYPARYKDLIADRGTTPGELGFFGKRQNNTDTVVVRLEGAKYDVHGIKYHPSVLLTDVCAKSTAQAVEFHADIHKEMLTGITSLSYETPGYGYAEKDTDGAPLLQKEYSRIAKKYGIPYVQDNAWGVPFIGSDPRKTGADVIIYSMDKASAAATSGLIIGKEEFMVAVRRSMGMHGDRYGTTASYGKAAFVGFDPGKEALLTQIQTLKVLRDNPGVYTNAVDALEKIIKEEFAKLPSQLQDGIIINKSYNSRAVEVNYEGTWKNGKMGIPIFSIEDMYSGTNIFQTGMGPMGVVPTVAYDGNIYISPDLATTDEDGNLLEYPTRWGVQALVRLIEITCKYAGIL